MDLVWPEIVSYFIDPAKAVAPLRFATALPDAGALSSDTSPNYPSTIF
jgi:hypothetical protein